MAAVYPVAAGVPTHSGNYTPEIFAAKLLVKFYRATVFSEIANTDYEGEIKSMGDTVHIRTVPDMVIRDYTIGQKLVRDYPVPGVVDLLINKGKYYSFAVNEVQKLQSDVDFQKEFVTDGGQRLAIKVDYDILSNIYADASADNKGTTAGVISNNIDLGTSGAPEVVTKANILEYIVDIGTVMDEQELPEDDRFLLLPSAFCGLVSKSDLKNASIVGDGEARLIKGNGKMGMIHGINIYKTNNLYSAVDGALSYNCIAGHKSGTTFASQLVHNREIDNPDDFGKVIEGLQVYGYEVVKPEAIVHFYARV